MIPFSLPLSFSSFSSSCVFPFLRSFLFSFSLHIQSRPLIPSFAPFFSFLFLFLLSLFIILPYSLPSFLLVMLSSLLLSSSISPPLSPLSFLFLHFFTFHVICSTFSSHILSSPFSPSHFFSSYLLSYSFSTPPIYHPSPLTLSLFLLPSSSAPT